MKTGFEKGKQTTYICIVVYLGEEPSTSAVTQLTPHKSPTATATVDHFLSYQSHARRPHGRLISSFRLANSSDSHASHNTLIPSMSRHHQYYLTLLYLQYAKSQKPHPPVQTLRARKSQSNLGYRRRTWGPICRSSFRTPAAQHTRPRTPAVLKKPPDMHKPTTATATAARLGRNVP